MEYWERERKRASRRTKGTGQAQTYIPRKRGKMSVEMGDDEKHTGTEKDISR